MIDKIYFRVLRKIYNQLQDKGVNWALTGSLSFALQAVPVEPHDIDVQADLAGALAIERYLSKFRVREVSFSSTEKMRSHLGELNIYGVKVELMGDVQKRNEDGTWEKPVDLQQHKRFVEVQGMHVPVLSLEYDYQAYLKLGRLEKAEMLRKVLEERGHAL